MIPANNIVKASAGAALLAVCALLSSSQLALAQADDLDHAPVVHSSAPLLAATGEKLLVCAANNYPFLRPAPPPTAPTTAAAVVSSNPTASLNVTLQILNGITGAVVAETQIAVPPLGSTEEPPDPCITFAVAPATVAAFPISLFVVRVLLNPQPLPPGICAFLRVSAQIFTPGEGGNPTNIRTISFLPPDPCVRTVSP